MSDLITYDDKIRLKSQNVSDKYKVTAEDMNEIKRVVNNNVEEVDEINNPENWVSVGTTAPTDGRRVWFKKSKNKLKLDNVSGTKNGLTYVWEGNKLTLDGTTTGATDIYNFGWWDATTQYANRLLPAGTYTLSIQGASNVGKFSLSLYYGTTSVIGLFRDYTNVSKTINSETYYSNCYISILANKTFNNEVFYIQLEEGSTATTYEPYTENPTINIDEEELHFDNYSTDELVIGKWIDGKPIYRKTYQITNITSSNTDLVDVSDLNFDTIIKLYGFIRSNPGMCMPMPLTDSSTNYNVLFLVGSKIRGRVAFGTGGSVRDCYVTIEYTKK